MTDLEMIKAYIDSGEISEAERKFLIDCMIKMRRNEAPLSDVGVENVIYDVRKLNLYLQNSEDTSLVRARINKELDIISSLSEGINDEKKLIEASYQLDQLYYQSDMPFRNTNTVLKKIVQDKSKSNSRGL